MRFNTNVLDLETVRKFAPAAFAQKPAAHVSPNYNFVDTSRVIDILSDAGFGVSTAYQQKSRDVENLETTKHSLSFVRRSRQELAPHLGTIVPMLTYTGSHDWSSQVVISAGIIRKVCANGAVGFVGMAVSIRHDHIPEDLNDIILGFAQQSDAMIGRAEKWFDRMLSNEEVSAFTMAAARIRFGEDANPDQAIALNAVNRSADQGNSLWTVYNRVQENAIRGGVSFGGMKRRARAISNIARLNEINSDLVKLAEFYS